MTPDDFGRRAVFGGRDISGVPLAPAWMPTDDNSPADLKVGFGAVPFGTIQAAIDRVIADCTSETAQRRRVIEIGPGFFEGPVVIPPQAPPITLRGAGAKDTILAAAIDAQMPGQEYAARFAKPIAAAGPVTQAHVAQITARQAIGTHNTAVLSIARDDVIVSGLTIRNDYQCDRVTAAPAGAEPDAQGRFAQGQHQAVAVQVNGADRVQIQECRLLSFQDTLYLRRPSADWSAEQFADQFSGQTAQLSRVALDRCLIEGDVDFIFGGATAHFNACEVRTRGARGAQSWAIAPSTSLHMPFGFVFESCAFTHDGAEAGQDGRSFLCRQWFEGVRATPYGTPTVPEYSCHFSDVNRFASPKGEISRTTLEAVGKCAVVRSSLGAHLDPLNLWDSWCGPDWSPRFRPVQRSGSDFLTYLSDWLATQGLEYRDLARGPAWLFCAEDQPNTREVLQSQAGLGAPKTLRH
jgi:pectinesterase